jgi:hypothetical protein
LRRKVTMRSKSRKRASFEDNDSGADRSGSRSLIGGTIWASSRSPPASSARQEPGSGLRVIDVIGCLEELIRALVVGTTVLDPSIIRIRSKRSSRLSKNGRTRSLSPSEDPTGLHRANTGEQRSENSLRVANPPETTKTVPQALERGAEFRDLRLPWHLHCGPPRA